MSERPDFDEDPEFLDDGEEVEPTDEFSAPIIERDVLGLMHVGHIEEKFEWGGHEFVMETPKAAAQLAVAQIINDYQGTMAQGRALLAAEVAASLKMVDGRELYVPLGDEPAITKIRKQFHYMLEKWNFYTIEILHGFWKQLQIRQMEAMEEFAGK